MQRQFIQRAVGQVNHLTPLYGLKKAERNRSWLYDPTNTRLEPILDHQGQVIVEAGTKVNPLDNVSWGDPVILIAGDDQQQIAWVIKQTGKIVLVNGSPIDLSEKLGRAVYFDQGGILVKRFNIEAVPAIIEQEGKKLKISQVKID